MTRPLLCIVLITAFMFACSWFTHEKRVIEIKLKPVKVIQAVVTAYSSTPEQTDDSPRVTASGRYVGPKVIACPKSYKFGTMVRILGKVYECADRMNQKFGERFDVWFEKTEDALAFGKKNITVEILALR